MMIGSVVALFGSEQLIFREPKSIGIILRVSFVSVLFWSLFLGIVGYHTKVLSSAVVGMVAIGGVAISELTFQWFRSAARLASAYAVFATWRVLLVLGCLFLLEDVPGGIGTIVVVAVACGSALGLLMIAWSNRTPHSAPIVHRDIHTISDACWLGGAFFLSSISLSIAAYGENLVVRSIGETTDVAQYFQTYVLFVSPSLILNQYLSVQIGLSIRSNEHMVISFINKYFFTLLPGFFIFMLSLLTCGYLLEATIDNGITSPLALAFLLTVSAFVRFIYILPSSFLGVAADRETLSRTAVIYLVSSALLPIVSLLLYSAGTPAAYAVAIGSLVNWSVRCLVGMRFVAQRIGWIV